MQPHYVSAINFFGRNPHEGHRGAAADPMNGTEFDESFAVGKVVARLRDANKWSSDEVTVTFVPLTAEASRGQEGSVRDRARQSAEQAKVTVRSVEIRMVSSN
jgi:hypothetical protein